MAKFFVLTASSAIALITAASAAAQVAVPPPVNPARDRAPPAVERIEIKHPDYIAPVALTVANEERADAAPAAASAGSGALSLFSSAPSSQPAAGTTLTPPITVNYAGTSTALFVTDTGTGRAIEGLIANTKNTNAALFGQSNGSGAGAVGFNNGIKGPGGNFAIHNPNNPLSAITATTNGLGSAIVATVTTALSTNATAIVGQNIVTEVNGVGVEGDGNYRGVVGNSTEGIAVEGLTSEGYGVRGSADSGLGVVGGSTTSIGVYGFSNSSDGMYASSSSGPGLYAYSETNYAVSATSNSGTAIYANSVNGTRGVEAHSGNGIAVFGGSDTGYGVWGQSTNSFGVIGEDGGSGVGVYGKSVSGYAGYFAGNVAASSYLAVSDRNAKTNIEPVDAGAILARVEKLPIASWDFKTDLTRRHVGPMAQDFHDAFGLDGNDDTHINLLDIAGVSLAAIQALSAEMTAKDIENKRLSDELSAQRRTIAELKSMVDSFSARMTVLEKQRDGAISQTASL